jgi:hypothetical protein
MPGKTLPALGDQSVIDLPPHIRLKHEPRSLNVSKILNLHHYLYIFMETF